VTSSASPTPKPTPRPAQSASPASLTKAAPADAAAASSTASTASRASAPAADQKARGNGKHGSEPSVGQLVSDASTHLSTLIRGEIELAKMELRSTVKNAGTGAGLFAAAGAVLVFSLTFGFLALAEGLAAAGLWRWAAFLIVFALQLVFVGLCVYLGVKKVRRVKAPELTIRTTKETVDYLKKSRE
jgi:hypothetical protein